MRKCESCYECCIIAKVTEKNFYKEAGVICPYVNLDNSQSRCKIFGEDNRPNQCRTFLCSWIRDLGNEEDRPDISNIMMSINNFNGGVWAFAIERKENALFDNGRNIVLEMSKRVDFPIIVCNYGTKPPNDFGDYTIVKNKIKYRAKKMLGDLIDYLDDEKEIGMYKLIIQKEK